MYERIFVALLINIPFSFLFLVIVNVDAEMLHHRTIGNRNNWEFRLLRIYVVT